MISRKLIAKTAGARGRGDHNIEGRAKIRKTADFYQSQRTVMGYLQSIKSVNQEFYKLQTSLSNMKVECQFLFSIKILFHRF